MVKWTDADLLELDKRFAAQGVEPHARPFRAAIEILGVEFNTLTKRDAIRAICDDFSKIVPGQPASSSGLGTGIICSGDSTKLVKLPLVFGQVQIKPFEILGFPSLEDWEKWCRKDRVLMWNSVHAASDIWDLANDSHVFASTALDGELFTKAREQISAYTSILSSNVDIQSSVQPLCLATELSVKSALAKTGYTEDQLKNEFSHNLLKAFERVCSLMKSAEDDMMKDIISKLPNYVKSRYTPTNFTRLQLVNRAVAVQYFCANIVRKFSATSLLKSFQTHPDFMPRSDIADLLAEK
jgi:hypothetical protein